MYCFTEDQSGVLQSEAVVVLPLLTTLLWAAVNLPKVFDSGLRALQAQMFFMLAEQEEAQSFLHAFSIQGEKWNVFFEASPSQAGEKLTSHGEQGGQLWSKVIEGFEKIQGAKRVSIRVETPHLGPLGRMGVNSELVAFMDPLRDSPRAWIPRGIAILWGVIKSLSSAGALGQIAKSTMEDFIEEVEKVDPSLVDSVLDTSSSEESQYFRHLVTSASEGTNPSCGVER